jgi:hypothetical protein
MRAWGGIIIGLLILVCAVYISGRTKEGFQERTIDVVVARYREPIDWLTLLDEYPIRNVYIYNKGPEQVQCPAMRATCTQIQLPNTGVCDHTYLYHISNSYERLADMTLFIPASAHNNSTKMPKVISALQKAVKEDKECMSGYMGDDTVYETNKGFYLDTWKVTDEKNRDEGANFELAKANPRPFGEWYKQYVPQRETRLLSLQGIFAVKRETIQEHPLSVYLTLQEQLARDKFPEAAHYMERSWGTLFPIAPENLL